MHCLAPGWIGTAWGDNAPTTWHERVLRETPLRRWGQPEDVAAVQIVHINGGAIR